MKRAENPSRQLLLPCVVKQTFPGTFTLRARIHVVQEYCTVSHARSLPRSIHPYGRRVDSLNAHSHYLPHRSIPFVRMTTGQTEGTWRTFSRATHSYPTAIGGPIPAFPSVGAVHAGKDRVVAWNMHASCAMRETPSCVPQ